MMSKPPVTVLIPRPQKKPLAVRVEVQVDHVATVVRQGGRLTIPRRERTPEHLMEVARQLLDQITDPSTTEGEER
jgi:hypothetical protein